MKQFKTDEEKFRKFLTKTERLVNLLNKTLLEFEIKQRMSADYALCKWECATSLIDIDNYKFELGMLKHPDAVKSDRYLEQEIPFEHE